LANVSGNTTLNGQGQTTRQTDLTTTLSARVTHVLPNGYLVVEGSKDIQVNSERQTVSVRGVVRPVDLSPGNLVPSTSLADLEVHINGKGVVNDAVRRPFFLYRLLLGLMPF
jgi:flagellar L-ring protein precursor FlgH